MIEVLIRILTPVFLSMGASAADVANYLRSLSGYVYAALFALLAVIVILIAAQFLVKKGKRHLVRWGAVVAWILLILILVNAICFGPMYPTISGYLNASRAEISEDVVGNSQEVIRETGEEGLVLLKNDGYLPLAAEGKSLNVFGWASNNTVFSGTGSAASGDANADAVTILKSLQDAGFATNEDLTKFYRSYASERPDINMNSQDWTLPEPPIETYSEELLNGAKSFSDTAVIVIGRTGGENADLPSDMDAVIHKHFNLADTEQVLESVKNNYGYTNGYYTNNSQAYNDFEPGEHYLELSVTEEHLVDYVCDTFSDVIVVINANNAMELGWTEEYDAIRAVIWAPGTGATGMSALGKIISGEVNPSGKTADTFLYDLTAAPTWNHSGNSGNHLITNASDTIRTLGRKDNTFQGVISFVDYVEGIYMGYKFYETAAEEGLIDFDKVIQYPFGYGLSYTAFSQEITSFSRESASISLEVTVTNTGDVAGKDVVELYVTPPYTNGGIEKASVSLVDFEKTGLLAPGESETISFTVPLENLASYDSECIKTENGGYILEAGDYTISIRSDSHTVLDQEDFTVDADIDYSKDGRPSDRIAPVNLFDYARGEAEILSRKDGFANYAKAVAPPSDSAYELGKADEDEIKAISVARYKPETYDDENDVMPTQGASGSLKLSDLSGKSYDDSDWEKLLNQMTVDEMVTLVNTGGWQTAEITSIGKVATSDCDGPAGLSNYITGSTGTQFTTEVLMAQTWNKELAAKIGDAIGQEFASADNYGWYGPAMNLHRSAFSGRNFEYYSEDAVLSGLFASLEVNAAAEYGVYPYIKHFAVNDQETNRCAFLRTFLTEQTLREVVLRPFETVVKNFPFGTRVMGVMTSYNWLGNVPVISDPNLLKTVLREEWGFVGAVISDYNGSYGYQISDAAIRAGNDLMLGYGMAESNQFEDIESATLVIALRQACKNILYVIGNSGYYEGDVATGGMSRMTRTFIIVDVLVVLLCAALMFFLIVRYRQRQKGLVTVEEHGQEEKRMGTEAPLP